MNSHTNFKENKIVRICCKNQTAHIARKQISYSTRDIEIEKEQKDIRQDKTKTQYTRCNNNNNKPVYGTAERSYPQI